MKNEYQVAIAGATGAVGNEMIKILEEEEFPVASLNLLASSRSVVRTLEGRGEDLPGEEDNGARFVDAKGTEVVHYTKLRAWDEEGRHLHDLRWGPGYLTSLGVQWQDGKQIGVWPNKWVAAEGAPEITYKGIQPYKIAPWIIEAYKK